MTVCRLRARPEQPVGTNDHGVDLAAGSMVDALLSHDTQPTPLARGLTPTLNPLQTTDRPQAGVLLHRFLGIAERLLDIWTHAQSEFRELGRQFRS